MALTSPQPGRKVIPLPTRRQVAGSTMLVAAATLASTMMGFAREVINARYFGTSWEMDTFLAAAVIPTILFGVFNGALVNALVPVFSELVQRGEEERAWRVASTVINTLVIVLGIGVVLGWILAPLYVPFVAKGFPAPQMGVCVHMTRIMLPTIMCTSLAGVLSAILYSHHRFKAPAVQGIAINFATIGGVLLWHGHFGIFALVFGTAIGLALQLAVQIPPLLRAKPGYRLFIDLSDPTFKKIYELLGPIIIGSAAGQMALFFDRYFASQLSPGYISGMNYATKLVGFPQQIFAAAIATVIFPLLSRQFARKDSETLRETILTGIRMVNFISVPAVVALIILARPIVATLFERGAFKSTATDLTAGLLPFAAVGLVALCANIVLTRCAFACCETRWPVAFAVGSVLLNVALSITWLPSLGARGLLLANSVSQTVQMIAMMLLVRHLVKGLRIRRVSLAMLRVLGAALVMGATLLWIQHISGPIAPGLFARIEYLVGQLAIGAFAFLAVAGMLRAPEVQLATKLLLDKLHVGTPSPSESTSPPIG
ncbi:MAG: murein biosynthesis integral membrane protein MurJ [Rhodanobacter sp.]|nr:MAG: murein biosynthesis integral membrane protein MurJ [Rhodanobacter sp.]